MTSLTSTSTMSKKLAVWAVFGIIGLILLFVILQVGKSLLNRVVPPPPLPASVAFGTIPKLDVNEGYSPNPDTNYIVETISGTLPVLTSQARVFRIREVVPTFGKLEDAVFLAKKSSFRETPIETSEGVAQFVHSKDKSMILTFNTFSGSFSINSDYLSKASVIQGKVVSPADITKNSYSLINKLGALTGNLPIDNVEVVNYKIENGFLEEAISFSETNLSKIIFMRRDIDGLPIVNPKQDEPLNWVLSNQKDYVAAQYTNNRIELYNYTTYPLKGSAKAFEDLKAGKAIHNLKMDSNVFVIRDVKLGYLETEKYQPYLQPVYIFVGDEGLSAYVSAVSNEWVNSDQPN